jgi:hypothetical protein
MVQEDVAAIHALYSAYLKRNLGGTCAPARSDCHCYNHHEEANSHGQLPEKRHQSHLEKSHGPGSQLRHFLRVSSQHVPQFDRAPGWLQLLKQRGVCSSHHSGLLHCVAVTRGPHAVVTVVRTKSAGMMRIA